jgi:UDP-glucose 4-epimerase
MKHQDILLLGGTSFIGKHLLERLHQQHAQVHVIARTAHTLPTLQGVRCYADSLDNVELLNTILPHCKTVVHLACDSTPGSSALKPIFEAEHNLLPTLRFLEVLQKHEHVSLIYVSSGGATYGNPTMQLVKEDEPLAPLSYYGAGKATLEKFIMAFCQQLQRSAIILRPSNFYGPGQPYRAGFGIIPTIFHHLLNSKPLTIWGDGETVRDYLYISDFIDLCIQMIEQPMTHTGTRIYNVGSEKGYSLNQLCTFIEEVTHQPITRQYQVARTVDVKRIVLDCTHLHNDLKWSPRVKLPTGLVQTWKWFTQQASRNANEA